MVGLMGDDVRDMIGLTPSIYFIWLFSWLFGDLIICSLLPGVALYWFCCWCLLKIAQERSRSYEIFHVMEIIVHWFSCVIV
jgi:hypothetical protein